MKNFFENDSHLNREDFYIGAYKNNYGPGASGRITRYQFSVLDKSTPFRHQLYLRNLGRMDSSRGIGPELEDDTRRGKKEAQIISGVNTMGLLMDSHIGQFHNFFRNDDADPDFSKFADSKGINLEKALSETSGNGIIDEDYSRLEEYSKYLFNPYYGYAGEKDRAKMVYSVPEDKTGKWPKMKNITDSNVLARLIGGDDPQESSISDMILRSRTSFFRNRDTTGEDESYYDPPRYYEEPGETGDGDIKEIVRNNVLSVYGDRKRYGERGDITKFTQDCFRNNAYRTMINRFYNNSTGNDREEITQSNITKQYGVSKGRNLLAVKPEDVGGYTNPYCRVWTEMKQYDRLNRAIRHRGPDTEIGVGKLDGFRPNGGSERLKNFSVLMDNGLPRYSPSYGEGNEKNEMASIKRCMFSIENLAWKGNDGQPLKGSDGKCILNESQIGPNNGRIMWFPPYNLKFTENIISEWSDTKFIGRGENIYTYSNTERDGTLSFTLLVDHPSSIDYWSRTELAPNEDIEAKKQFLLRYFAGCETGDDLNRLNENKGKGGDPKDNRVPGKKGVYKSKEVKCLIFFPNNYSGRDNGADSMNYLYSGNVYGYEMTSGAGLSTGISEPVMGKYYYKVDNSAIDEELLEENYRNDNSDCLNSDVEKAFKNMSSRITVSDDDVKVSFKELYDFLIYGNSYGSGDKLDFINQMRDGKIDGKVTIYYEGFASSHGTASKNKDLADNRAETAKKWLESNLNVNTGDSKCEIEFKPLAHSIIDVDGRDTNGEDARRDRFVILTFTIADKHSDGISPENDRKKDNKREYKDRTQLHTVTMIDEKDLKYDDEYQYFKTITKDQSIYQDLVEKVKYFNPAFHSITPEGFNARLTFLQQCTRQGPTNSGDEGAKGNANNLSFGRPPFCILRIGDFYNTKIAINAISINYSESGSPQWDLNPEGIGIQPMFANVDINFKFLGGSDISGPIEELQNAVSFNYFGNTSVYDRRSTYNKDK